ncbi:hypothetical protein TUSST3_90080 [Streptomyces sp. TUS-ST3]|nr:hypothetical protein TUSST3_90080 [Streptomyces sp. TUS-ST3]
MRGAPEAVLGAEDGPQVHSFVRMHHVDDVPDVPGDAGGVGDDADALTLQLFVAARNQVLETGTSARVGCLGGGCGGE